MFLFYVGLRVRMSSTLLRMLCTKWKNTLKELLFFFFQYYCLMLSVLRYL
jgi:hypothetical protein